MTIGDKPVGIYTGEITLDPDEIVRTTKTCQRVHNHLCDVSGCEDFLGTMRQDLVPNLTGEQFGVKALIEANYHGPEDIGAMCAVPHFYRDLTCINVAAKVANRLAAIVGKDDIAFVAGHGALKDEWKSYFFEELARTSLNISWVSADHLMTMQEPPLYIWCWGDIRRPHQGASDFSEEFVTWAFEAEKCGHTFINSLPGEHDIARKSNLISGQSDFLGRLVGRESRPLGSEDDVVWALGENRKGYRRFNLVLKPDDGSSGSGITFGRLCKTQCEWENALVHALQRREHDDSFSLWRFRSLPRTRIGGMDVAMDASPFFFVDGRELEYIYTLIRVRPWDEYEKYLVLNVSAGAGFMPAKN